MSRRRNPSVPVDILIGVAGLAGLGAVLYYVTMKNVSQQENSTGPSNPITTNPAVNANLNSGNYPPATTTAGGTLTAGPSTTPSAQ